MQQYLAKSQFLFHIILGKNGKWYEEHKEKYFARLL